MYSQKDKYIYTQLQLQISILYLCAFFKKTIISNLLLNIRKSIVLVMIILTFNMDFKAPRLCKQFFEKSSIAFDIFLSSVVPPKFCPVPTAQLASAKPIDWKFLLLRFVFFWNIYKGWAKLDAFRIRNSLEYLYSGLNCFSFLEVRFCVPLQKPTNCFCFSELGK